LWLPPDESLMVNNMKALVQRNVPLNETILIAPYWPTFYPILGKKSPVWEIYFLFPQSKQKQYRMIADLSSNNVKWAIVCNQRLDNREELSFSHTHNDLWQYLMENFQPVDVDWLPRECQWRHRTEKIDVK
jgi:hypothetical protein